MPVNFEEKYELSTISRVTSNGCAVYMCISVKNVLIESVRDFKMGQGLGVNGQLII